MAPGNANQSRFLGSLMGMGIGDAMGMPVAGWSAAEIVERYRSIDGFHRRVFEDGAEIKAGEFTDESEIALCIVESATANGGLIDPDLIGPRMLFLARGESKRWMHPDTLTALERAEETLEFILPLNEDGPVSGDVAVRGVPVGLLHAVGNFDVNSMRVDAERVVRITHGSPVAIDAATSVAHGVMLAARGNGDRAAWRANTAEFLASGSIAEALRRETGKTTNPEDGIGSLIDSAFTIAAEAVDFESAIRAAVNLGGATDSRGAIVGALVGAWIGVEGIPQHLIDDFEGRIYVSLAAPWFYKSAIRRAGMVIDLRQYRG